MTTVKIFKAGNSLAVTVPRELADRYDLGLSLRMVPQAVEEGILYRPLRRKAGAISAEYQRWLKGRSKKYALALRVLAKV